MTIGQLSDGMKLRATSTGAVYRVQSVGDERVITRGPWGSAGVDRDELVEHIERALYEIVRDAEEIASAELYERYQDRVDDPRSDRTVRNYLSKLTHYNLVEKEGEGRSRTYQLPE